MQIGDNSNDSSENDDDIDDSIDSHDADENSDENYAFEKIRTAKKQIQFRRSLHTTKRDSNDDEIDNSDETDRDEEEGNGDDEDESVEENDEDNNDRDEGDSEEDRDEYNDDSDSNNDDENDTDTKRESIFESFIKKFQDFFNHKPSRHRLIDEQLGKRNLIFHSVATFFLLMSLLLICPPSSTVYYYFTVPKTYAEPHRMHNFPLQFDLLEFASKNIRFERYIYALKTMFNPQPQ